jgi:hypothetical protein
VVGIVSSVSMLEVMTMLYGAPTVLMALVCLAASDVHPGQKTGVIGLWLGESRSRGGLGRWLELRANGTAQYSVGALVEFTYVWQDPALSLTPAGKTDRVPLMEMQINGDTAVRRQPPPDAPPRDTLPPDQRAMLDRMSQPLAMRRVGAAAPGAPLIVGTWTYEHYTGATAFERFTPGGSMILLVEMQASQGTYTLLSDRIVVDLPDGAQTFLRKDDALVSAAGGKPLTFRRAPQ